MLLKNKFLKLLICCVGVASLVSSCKKGLDYKNVGAIAPDNVWQDPNMIKGFLSDIYGVSMPGWPVNGRSSDEGFNTPRNMSDYLRGIISEAATTSGLNYGTITKINFFLENVATVPAAIIPEDVKKQYIGEAKFWRAWHYWGMVNALGGVPLILHPQDETNVADLFVARNKTSECIAQIVKDLDSAALLLPGKYTNAGVDYGRITKVAAMAVKGRVLLSYASPLFNPTNDQARWQAAYDANKAAVDFAVAQGHGLFPNVRNVWYTERNQEVIMVNQFYALDHMVNFNSIRPEPMTNAASWDNQPLLSLLMSFPKRDGSPMQLDTVQLQTNAAYNAQFLTDFYTNRDDRFYATIFCGGTPYPTPDEVAPVYVKGNSYWNCWRQVSPYGYTNIVGAIHSGMPGSPGSTGFCDRKGLDTTITGGNVAQGQTDWIEIRFAEVLMNYGECANELGKSSEALNVLYSIRQRANITPGAGNTYGVTATTKPQIRDAYITERQVEFAFENKRFGDLRRWKRYDILNTQGARHGLFLTLKPSEYTLDAQNKVTSVTVKPSDNIMNAAVRSKFTANYINNLDGDAGYKFALDLNHWFYAIPPSQVTQGKGFILQNKEWGGTFDPLQ